eukprot:3367426-Pleurochrysis_carterae.AAC.1
MRPHGVGRGSRPCEGGHDRRSEAASRAYKKESMKVTTQISAEAWIEISERESSEAKVAMRRSPPSCGERASMMPAVSAAARKTTL